MSHEKAYQEFYANQLLRLYHAEQEVSELVDTLLGTVAHGELKQVLEKEKRLLDQECQTIRRMYDRLGIEGEIQRAESFVQAVREAEAALEDLRALEPNVRDLEIIAMFQQLKAREEGTIRSLLTYAEERNLDDDVRQFQSMLQRENNMDEKLTNVARNNLYDHGGGKTGEPRRPAR